MKLRGSMLEDDIRQGLIVSRQTILGEKQFEDARFIHLLKEIKIRFPDFKTAYLLSWVPDQNFDCYFVLIDTQDTLYIDIDRDDWSVNEAEIGKVLNYKKSLKKHAQLQLMIALDLAANDMQHVNQKSQTPLTLTD